VFSSESFIVLGLTCTSLIHFELVFIHGIETGVLGPRPKLLGFCMSGPATCPYWPNEEASSGKGQRREIYYTAQGASAHFSHLHGIDMSFRFK
jgi:hypothetical protein